MSEASAGPLWRRTCEVWERALAAGTLEPIETQEELLRPPGQLPFLLKTITSVRRKPERATAGGNPFLPPEPGLLVGELGPAHRAVLNRFPVLERHLLIVTRHFEHQRTTLTEADFAALFEALGAVSGLGFYNGGKQAGASQPHKHLQLVPRPLSPLVDVPLSPILEGAPDALPFPHAVAPCDPDWWARPSQAAPTGRLLFRRLLGEVGLDPGPEQDYAWPFETPFNLLLTRQWMLVVPRSAERFSGISVNSLGFAGCLLARNEAERVALAEAGLERVLSAVAGTSSGPGGSPGPAGQCTKEDDQT